MAGHGPISTKRRLNGSVLSSLATISPDGLSEAEPIPGSVSVVRPDWLCVRSRRDWQGCHPGRSAYVARPDILREAGL
jgi:hypothetical protein